MFPKLKGIRADHESTMDTTTIIKVTILSFLIFSLNACTLKQLRPLQGKAISPQDIYDQAAEIIEKNYINSSGEMIKLNRSVRPDINSILSQLDSTSILLTPKEFSIASNPFSASVGLELKKNDDGIVYVARLLKDSPALRSGLLPGDEILEIDGEPTQGLNLPKCLLRLKGAPGSEIAIKISRGDNENKIFTIKRQIVNAFNEPEIHRLGERIAYIWFAMFHDKIANQLKSAIKELTNEGIKGLILDLRGNYGGPLPKIVEASQLFLKRGTTVVQIKRQGDTKPIYAAGWSHYLDFPMVVLIDRTTSSGAEAMAAALQEGGRAVLIGEKTMGAGSIYSVFPLHDGSHLYIRTQFMYTPNSKKIDVTGIMPDIEVQISNEESKMLNAWIYRNVYDGAPTVFDDIQLNKAVSYLNK